jgi:RHS repeat-associated protein
VMTRDNTSQFIYNARDERVAVYDSGTWRWTLRDGNAKVLRVFTSRDGSSGFGKECWTWVKDYVWRDDMLLASRQKDDDATTTCQPEDDPTTTYHYHLDHLGTPRRITDDKETIVGFHDYYAFGPEISSGLNEKSRTDLKYTAHERHDHGDEFTLDYMHARYYNPAFAKFLSVDPARTGKPGDPQSWNRYTYARNSPLRLIDPNGLQSMDHKILHVHVNLVYSNVDNKGIWSGATLRQQTERGAILTRQYFNQMGISVTFHRYEGSGIDLSTYDKKATNVDLLGKVQTANGEMTPLDFAKSNYGKALTVFVSGDISLGNDSHGGTLFHRGTQLLSILPALASAKTLPHEIAHALGNTIGSTDNPAWGANALTDFIWFMERQQFNMGVGFSMEFERWVREGAEKLDQ